MDVLFYHLTESRIEQALPQLVERCLARDWRVLVQVGDEAMVKPLDEALWTYSDASFLPHAAEGEGNSNADPHPVWLSRKAEASAGRHVHFAVAGAVPEGTQATDRLIYMFDGHNEEAVLQARERWTVEKDAGHDLTYWQQSDAGWTKAVNSSS
jgi:DNA polymerase-3 subunit chi